MDAEKTAAIIIIGDEILAAKVQEANQVMLLEELRDLGVRVRFAFVLPDEPDDIGRVINDIRTRVDFVITTGGVGPTHDDKTFDGIARGLGVKIVRNEEMVRQIEAFYGDAVNDDILSMADLPEGAILETDPGLTFPLVRIENIYVLPGEPTILRRKWAAIKERFRSTPFFNRRLYTSLDEGDLASDLREIEEGHPNCLIGSYPRYDPGAPYQVMITVESKDSDAVEEAFKALHAAVPKDTHLDPETF